MAQRCLNPSWERRKNKTPKTWGKPASKGKSKKVQKGLVFRRPMRPSTGSAPKTAEEAAAAALTGTCPDQTLDSSRKTGGDRAMFELV